MPLLFSCGENENNNDLDNFNLEGNIKEIIETNFNVKEYFGDIEKTDILSTSIKKFDEEGYCVKYEYKGDDLNWIHKYKFDEDGNKIETKFYTDGELKSKDKYKYDEDRNCIERKSYNPDGELVSKIKFKNDDDGNCIEQKSYNPDGELDSKSKAKYDEDGNKIEAIHYTDDELKSKEKYKYDEDGNPIKIEWDYSTSTYKYKYKYDEDGNKIEMTNYIDGELISKHKYKYDEYDKENNWIIMIEYDESDTPLSITEREIDYY